jgi:hypothetical protein
MGAPFAAAPAPVRGLFTDGVSDTDVDATAFDLAPRWRSI